MDEQRIRRVVVLGGGTAGWMTAAALSKINTPKLFDLTLVESDEIGAVGVGEATIPTIHWFNQLAGVDEADLFRETKATYKLGIEFPNWRREGAAYFHPFGRYGGPRDQSMFYHRWIRQRLRGRIEDPAAFSFTTQLARAGRFARPASGDTLAATLGYAFHFDASLYARFLRRLSEARGLRRVEGRVSQVHQDGGSGFVAALSTDRGDRVEGDLFIDCSGFRGLLIQETLKVPFEDWSRWLPCDRALAVPTERRGPPAPYTQAIARPAGWQWRIPLQHRTGNGLVYCSAHLDDDAARELLLSNLAETPLADPRPVRFQAGLRRAAWSKNVVSIGLSSGFLEPLESTSIHFIQSGIAKLLALFPSRACPEVVAEQFNRIYRADMESARDVLILHYRASERPEPFWREVRSGAAPDSLAFRIESFVRTGRIVLGSDELFKEASWFSILIGQGVEPRDYNPLVEGFEEARDLASLKALESAISEAARRAPTHEAALAQILAQPGSASRSGEAGVSAA